MCLDTRSLLPGPGRGVLINNVLKQSRVLFFRPSDVKAEMDLREFGECAGDQLPTTVAGVFRASDGALVKYALNRGHHSRRPLSELLSRIERVCALWVRLCGGRSHEIEGGKTLG